MSIDPMQYTERLSGYPQPGLYDQYYINKYAYPKGLKSYKRSEAEMKEKNARVRAKRKSLYDLDQPANRKGFSGWKLTMGASPFADKNDLSILE